MNNSEVARIRQQIELESAAMKLAHIRLCHGCQTRIYFPQVRCHRQVPGAARGTCERGRGNRYHRPNLQPGHGQRRTRYASF
jgi:hypothetical protein